MSFLAKQYWMSEKLADIFHSADLQLLYNRNYRAILKTDELDELALKVILCHESECSEIIERGHHHYGLCFVLSESENPRAFPIGEEAFFFINPGNLQNYSDLLKLYEDSACERIEQVLCQRMEETYRELLETTTKVMPPKGRTLNKDYQAIFGSYLSWAPVFLGAENGESFRKLVIEKGEELWPDLELKVFLKKNNAFEAILSGTQVTSVGDVYLGWRQKTQTLSPAHGLIITLHLELIHAYMSDEKKREKIVVASSFWEDVLDRLVDPIALLSGEGDLLICNHAFSKAGFLPREFLKLADGETTEKNDQYYNVTKRVIDISGEERFFILLEAESAGANTQMSGRGATEELGIISSSLAHELKNPIAGILAASSVLGYLDGINEENMGQIDEMRQSAKRCQNLIEIFLGFSKVETPHGHHTSMESALTQAFELLKFRMIETHVRLEWNVKKGAEFHWDVNPSVASMIFYLILSEIMTYGAHGQLVASLHSDFSIGMESHIEEEHLTLKINPKIEGMSGLKSHKLLGHLLEWEALQIVLEEEGITLLKGGH